MKDLENSLKAQFGLIAPDELTEIAALFRPEVIAKGDFFLKSGTYCRKLSFIRSGFLRIFVATEKKEITQWISSKDYFVTDLTAFFYDTPARWSIQALEDTELYTISKEDYNRIQRLVPKWNELEKSFIIHCFTTLEDRIFGHLSMSAEERYAYFFAQHRELFQHIPLQYIASMLGMTPETFSRIRRKQLG